MKKKESWSDERESGGSEYEQSMFLHGFLTIILYS